MLLDVSRFKILPLTILALTCVCLGGFACQIATGQQWPKLRVKESIEWSAELEVDLPFDVSKNKNLNEADNRAQGYFRIIATLFSNLSNSPLEDASTGTEITFKSMPAKLRRTAKKMKIARDKFDKFARKHRKDLWQACQDETQEKDIRKLVKPFDWVFEDLAELHESRKGCVLVNGVSRFSDSIGLNFRFVAQLASVRYLLSPASESALDDLGMVFELMDDLNHSGGMCYQTIVKGMLDGKQSLGHLDRLIEILKQHSVAVERSHPALQDAKTKFLRRKSAYLRLRRIILGLPVSESLLDTLWDIGINRSWSSYDDDVMWFWLKSTRPADEKAFVEDLFLKGQLKVLSDRRAANEQWVDFIEARAREMTAADISRDLEVLKLRYEEIEKLVPNRSQTLKRASTNLGDSGPLATNSGCHRHC